MGSSTVIDNADKIGIGTYPVAGFAAMLDGIQAVQAKWFYTWGGQLPSVEFTGWSLGSGASSGGVSSDQTLKLGIGADAWASQSFSVAGGRALTLSFAAETLADSLGGVVVNYLDAQHAVIGTSYLPVVAGTEQYVLDTITPERTAEARLTAYTAAGIGVTFDDFAVRAGATNLIQNGGFEQVASTSGAAANGFVPMVWGAADMSRLASIAGAPTPELLTFNEPDNRNQANLTVAQALNYWTELMATGKRLGSPATTVENTLGENSWLGKFMSGADAAGYRVDFVAVHYYTTDPSVEAFRSFLEKVHEAYGKPIWVTEWSLADWQNEARFTTEQQKAFFTAATHMMDDLPYVERHAWFSAYEGLDSWDLNTGLMNLDGTLTSIGHVFAELAGQDRDILEGRFLTGTAGADRLVASSDEDWAVEALDGDDVVITQAGDDTINAGAGDDTIFAGAGNDVINFFGTNIGFDAVDGGVGGDRIVALASDTSIGLRSIQGVETISAGAFAGVRIHGSEPADVLDFSATDLIRIEQIEGRGGNDTLTGSVGADTLMGGAGNDVIEGGQGDDVLVGGIGKDLITGGAGADQFVFAVEDSRTGGGLRDVITDFTSGTDKLDLGALNITDFAAQFSIQTIGSGLIAYVDTDHDGIDYADFALQLTGVSSLAAGDILF